MTDVIGRDYRIFPVFVMTIASVRQYDLQYAGLDFTMIRAGPAFFYI
jgi:hypothetical protein